MKKIIQVSTERQALKFCKEHQCDVQFRNETKWLDGVDVNTSYVIVKFGLISTVRGQDLIEAVNRTLDLYHTRPADFDKLSWWDEHRQYCLM